MSTPSYARQYQFLLTVVLPLACQDLLYTDKIQYELKSYRLIDVDACVTASLFHVLSALTAILVL